MPLFLVHRHPVKIKTNTGGGKNDETREYLQHTTLKLKKGHVSNLLILRNLGRDKNKAHMDESSRVCPSGFKDPVQLHALNSCLLPNIVRAW